MINQEFLMNYTKKKNIKKNLQPPSEKRKQEGQDGPVSLTWLPDR